MYNQCEENEQKLLMDRQTDRPTDRQQQSNMPLDPSSKRGIPKVKKQQNID
jgi:hypothetical protein